MTISFDSNPFWDHSLAVYGRDGVSAACIALQDRRGVDVNLLLYCLWDGAEGGAPLGAADFDQLAAVSAGWNADVIRRLRAARLAIKNGFEALPEALRGAFRKRILEIEIDGERGEQLLLAPALERSRDPARPVEERARATATSLLAYLAYGGTHADEEDIDDLLVLLAATFPELDRNALAALLPA